jgi:hypothetical protein
MHFSCKTRNRIFLAYLGISQKLLDAEKMKAKAVETREKFINVLQRADEERYNKNRKLHQH